MGSIRGVTDEAERARALTAAVPVSGERPTLLAIPFDESSPRPATNHRRRMVQRALAVADMVGLAAAFALAQLLFTSFRTIHG